MIDHNELEAMAELLADEDHKTRECPFSYKEGFVDGFIKGVRFVENFHIKQNIERMQKGQRNNPVQGLGVVNEVK